MLLNLEIRNYECGNCHHSHDHARLVLPVRGDRQSQKPCQQAPHCPRSPTYQTQAHAPPGQPIDQKTDQPMRELSNSSAAIPASELPAALSSGDHTQTVNCPGTIATMPPPTPLFPGNPTR